MVSVEDFVKDMERRLQPSLHRPGDTIRVTASPDVDYDMRIWYNAREKTYIVDFWSELRNAPPRRLQQAVAAAEGDINLDSLGIRQASRLLNNIGLGKLDALK